MSTSQLNALKRLLARKPISRNSVRLDTEILRVAKTESERIHRDRPTIWQRLLSAPLANAGSAVASAIITALVFLFMAQVTTVAEHPITANQLNESNRGYLGSDPARLGPLAQESPTLKPSYSPDQVLLEMSLPSVADLIKSMEFVAESERTAATIELISALADINTYIGAGDLKNARARYFDLRERCYACQLPRSLEALALNHRLRLDKG